jgi:ADP-ribose pyrophosphatase
MKSDEGGTARAGTDKAGAPKIGTSANGAPRERKSTLGSRRIYSGRVMNLDVDRVLFPDGTSGELELIRHSGAAAVVPFLDPPNDDSARILLIRQFRYAADRFLFEIPAGRIDASESPIECARRELKEEAGCDAEVMMPLGGYFTTPGFIDEYIHAFLATGLTRGAPSLEADEFIQPESHTLQGGLRMIDRGEIVDAKTIIALFMADRLIRSR